MYTKAAAAFALLFLGGSAYSQVVNGSFESPTLGANQWIQNPTGIPGWTFSGRSGICRGNTPYGSTGHTGPQYIFMGTDATTPGKVTQTVGGLVPGNFYRLRFFMQPRPGNDSARIGVNMNGTPILQPINTVGTWIEFGTQWFQASATSAVFEIFTQFENFDRSVAIDDVVLEQGTPAGPGFPRNGSFESPQFQPNLWQYAPNTLDIGWTLIGGAGIANGGGPWGSGAFDGAQYAFMQTAGVMEQTVGNFSPSTSYHIEWWMMRRNGNSGGNDGQPIRLRMDGAEIFPPTLYNSPIWKRHASNPFKPSGETGVLRFEGTSTDGDRTELIDAVTIIQNTDLVPSSYLIELGKYISGDLTSVAMSDDNHLRIGPPLFSGSTPRVRVVFESTSPILNANYIGVTLEAAASTPGLNQTIELWNFITNTWDVVNSSLTQFNDTNFFAALADDQGRYVHPTTGNVKVRVSVLLPVFGSANWQYKIDRVGIAVSPPPEF